MRFWLLRFGHQRLRPYSAGHYVFDCWVQVSVVVD